MGRGPQNGATGEKEVQNVILFTNIIHGGSSTEDVLRHAGHFS